MPETLLGIGQLAERSGIAVSALRYYEDAGLLRAIRSAGGNRLFPRSALRRVSFIRITQRLGYRLEDIRQALATLPDNRTPTQADWRKLANTMRRDLDQRIADLQRLRDSLEGCIGCGCLSLRKCQLYNPDDTVSAEGPGPRFLLGPTVDSKV